jgi:hypothetical protein
MDAADPLIDVLLGLGSKTFYLEVVSWQQLFHNATREQANDPRIKLKCRARSEGYGFTVGEAAEDLHALDYLIEVRSHEKNFSDFDIKNPEKAEEPLIFGLMDYHPSVSLLREDVPNKIGSVTGAVFFGNQTIWKMSDLLSSDFSLEMWITVKASTEASPNALIYSRRHSDRMVQYHWSQDETLCVTEAVFVVSPPLSRDVNSEAVRPAKPSRPWRFLKRRT